MATLINPSPDVLDSELKLYRYWNLRGIVEASSNAIVADMLKKKTSYITAIADPNPNRAIGDDIALEIEAAFHMPVGGMDAKPDRRISNEDPKIAEVARMMSVANELDKSLLLRIAKQIFGHSIDVSAAINNAPGRIIYGEAILARANEKATGVDVESVKKNSDNQ